MILRAVVGALTVWTYFYCCVTKCIQVDHSTCKTSKITTCQIWNKSKTWDTSDDDTKMCYNKENIKSVKLCYTRNKMSCFTLTLEKDNNTEMTMELFMVGKNSNIVINSTNIKFNKRNTTSTIEIQNEQNYLFILICHSTSDIKSVRILDTQAKCNDFTQSTQTTLYTGGTTNTTVSQTQSPDTSSNTGGIAAAVIVLVLFVALVVVVVILYRRGKLQFLKNHPCVSFLANNKSSKSKSDDCVHPTPGKDTGTTTQTAKGLSISSPTELMESTRPLEGDYSIVKDEDVRGTQAAGGSLLSPLKPNVYSNHPQSKLPGNNDPVYHEPDDVPVGGFYHIVEVNEDPSPKNDPGIYHILEAGSDYPAGHASGEGRSVYQFASHPGELTSAPPPSAKTTAKNSREGDYDKLQVKGQTPAGTKRGEGEEGNTYSHLTDNDDPDAYHSVTREVKPTVIDGDYSHLNDQFGS